MFWFRRPTTENFSSKMFRRWLNQKTELGAASQPEVIFSNSLNSLVIPVHMLQIHFAKFWGQFEDFERNFKRIAQKKTQKKREKNYKVLQAKRGKRNSRHAPNIRRPEADGKSTNVCAAEFPPTKSRGGCRNTMDQKKWQFCVEILRKMRRNLEFWAVNWRWLKMGSHLRVFTW